MKDIITPAPVGTASIATAVLLHLITHIWFVFPLQGRGCQIRNFAGRPVDFYWMDVNTPVSSMRCFSQ